MRRRALLCVLVAAWLAVWVPPAWAAFHLERADGSAPVKGINLAPYVDGGRTFGQPVGTLQVARPRPKVVQVVSRPSGSVWDRLAACESGGNWRTSTGNGYHGGLQFSQRSWAAVGGQGNPAAASREEQIHRAEKLKALQGWGAWPACSRKLGLR